jgi:hypothetical protein
MAQMIRADRARFRANGAELGSAGIPACSSALADEGRTAKDPRHRVNAAPPGTGEESP